MRKLARHARILVTDGAKALVLRNDGSAANPALKLVRAYAQDNPPSREQGTDRPGRTNDSMGRKSAMEPTDWHRLAEDRFVAQVAGDMDRDLRAGEYGSLIVAAPPVALGEYRKARSAAVAGVTVIEIGKDLTKHPAPEIARIVMRALEEA